MKVGAGGKRKNVPVKAPSSRSAPKATFKRRSADRIREPQKNPRLWGALCDSCPLKGAMPVWDDGPSSPLLAVVGEAPGRQELDVGVPFVGKSGEYLQDKLSEKGLSRRDVLLANALLCFPPGGDLRAFLQGAKKSHKEENKATGEKTPFASPIDCCRPRLMYSLGVPRCAGCLKWDVEGNDTVRCSCVKPRWTKPSNTRVQVVLATGNAALESLRGEGGIKAKLSYIFPSRERAK